MKKQKTERKRISVAEGHYVIMREGKKNHLVQITGIGDGVIHGVLDKDRHIEPYNVDFEPDQVVANLGPNPLSGNVLGVKVEPFERSLVHESWGDVHFFKRPEKPFLRELKDALDFTANRIKQARLTAILPLIIEVRPPKGKYSGWYKYTGHDKDEKPDVMCLKPKETDDLKALIYHESGHGVWYRMMGNKARAAWVKLYHQYVVLSTATPSLIDQLLTDFKASESYANDFAGQLEEDEALVFWACISHISSIHNLDVKYIDLLIRGGEAEALDGMWPRSTVDISDMEVEISEYATKNPEELWAESFKMHMLNMKLPERVQKLMERTLASCLKKK